MKRVLLIAIIIALAVPAILRPEEQSEVSGFGAYPISGDLTSLWLLGPDHHPLLMAYFHGREGWHKVLWKTASEFGKTKTGWVELQSKKITLRLSMNTETGEVGVQSGTFRLDENNTFLVLHMGEPSTAQKIIPLGIFDLPESKDQPASVLLIQGNLELVQRINKELAADKH
jgi:hypothetical protein